MYAKYIGRVGALAVALGVTGAIASSPGVAWADDTSPSDASSQAGSSASSDTDPASTATTGVASSNTAAPPTGASTPPTTNTATTDSDGDTGVSTGVTTGSQKITNLNKGVVIRSSGGGFTSGANKAAKAQTTDADEQDSVDTTTGPPTETQLLPTAEIPPEPPAAAQPPAAEEEPPAVGEESQPPTDEDTGSGSDPTAPPATPPAPPSVTIPDNNDTPAPNIEDTTGLAADTTGLAVDLAEDTTGTDHDTAHSHDAEEAFSAAHVVAPASSAATNPIAAALAKLPTPQQVVAGIKRAVTQCACEFINGALKLVNGFTSMVSSGPASPTSPAETPVAWTVLGWVQRQFSYAVTAFNRTPIGQFIHGITSQITGALDDFGNSPTGRLISSQLSQFLEECSGKASLPADLDRLGIVGGLTEPTDFDFLNHVHEDGEVGIHRILITEKSGAVKVYDPHTGTVSTLVNLPTVNADGERGLVGIEVDPQFWDVGAEGYHKIYVAYSNADNYDQLAQLELSTSLDSIIGDPKVLLASDQLGNNFHHGGEIEFDPTGQYIYWAVGDNTNSANAQDLTNIHGKILRLDRNGDAPEDNPFFNTPGAVKQIWAYGLRNPFRFTFTSDGVLLAGDVGEASWEELNVITKGGNYGWPGAEGACNDAGCADTIDPLYAYAHSSPPANIGSITSVVHYTGTTLPEDYHNKVFIADYSNGWIKELTFDDEFTSLISERTLDSSAGATVKMMQGPDGNIYQLNIYPGTLSILTASGGNRAPNAVITADHTYGAGDSLDVQFSAGNSTDPDSDDLTYQWNFGNGTTSTSATPTVTFTNTGGYTAYTVTLTVDDGTASTQTTQRIVVGSTPPPATINVSDTKYNAGDTLTFTAPDSVDTEDGTLPASAYKWTVVFHHAEHTHPFQDNIVGQSGSLTIPRTPDQLANTWYRVHLAVTDSSGLTTTTYQDVSPNVVRLAFDSNYPDATFTIDGQPRKSGYWEDAVVGVQRVISAPATQHLATGDLVFGGWGHGGDRTQTITTPTGATTYTVTFNPANQGAAAGMLV